MLTSHGTKMIADRDAGKVKGTPMSWADTVKATALAALAERPATAGRISVDTPWRWNPHETWLTRVRQPRELAAQSSKNGPAIPPRSQVRHGQRYEPVQASREGSVPVLNQVPADVLDGHEPIGQSKRRRERQDNELAQVGE
jgi:hypothetical protein